MRVSRPLSAFICVPLWLILLSGCNKPAASLPADAAKPEPAVATTYQVVHPARKTVTLKIEQPGQVEEFEATAIFAKIEGFVRAVNVDIDDPVDEQKVLVELDVPEMVAEAERRKADVALAEAEIAQAKSALAVADARLEGAQALVERWNSEDERSETLVEGKVIDEQTRDETKLQFKAAEATRKERAAQRLLALDDITAAEKKLDVASAAHKRALALLVSSPIHLPYACVIRFRTL